MIARALEKYLRISPKKLRLAVDLVNKKRVDRALYTLVNTKHKSADVMKKVIESALNNARRIPEQKFNEENLYVSKVIVNGGPALKRYRAMSMGRAGIIRKRTSHVLIELEAIPGKTEKKSKVVSSKKTVKKGKV